MQRLPSVQPASPAVLGAGTRPFDWSAEGAGIYFASLGYELRLKYWEWQPWAPTFYLQAEWRQFEFETLVDLWNWWAMEAANAFSRKAWMEQVAACFAKATGDERHAMWRWSEGAGSGMWALNRAGIAPWLECRTIAYLPSNWWTNVDSFIAYMPHRASGNHVLAEFFTAVEARELDCALPVAMPASEMQPPVATRL